MNRRMEAQAVPPPAAQPPPTTQPAPVPPPASDTADDTSPSYVAELEQLASLRDAGILTDDEFEAKKRQILGL